MHLKPSKCNGSSNGENDANDTKDFKKTKKVLEINLKNPLIQKLEKIHSSNSKDEILKDVAEQLFDNSELIEEASEQINSMIPNLDNS